MKVKKFQAGGPAPASQPGAPAPAANQPSPEEQIMAMAQQIIQQIGPEAAAVLAQAILQMLQTAQPQAPRYQRKGGKLVMIGRE